MEQRICDREQDLVETHCATHAQLCKDLKITAGKYGGP
jgi:hypothetical protein